MSTVQISRADSLARVADHEASTLYEQHRHRIYRFCLGRLGDREEAHDAVQDTYAKAWLALRDGCEVREPLAWLLTIARNVCASRFRARSARPIETPLYDEAIATVTYLNRAELAGLPAAVRALPDEQRRAFVLRELRGCSYEEICETMGASHASVAALLHRARRSVAAALGGTGKRVLVLVPFPAVVRSAFEGSGGVIAATAAATATATGTMLLVGPHVPLRHHDQSPPPARVQPSAGSPVKFIVPMLLVSRSDGRTATQAASKKAALASTQLGAAFAAPISSAPSAGAPVPAPVPVGAWTNRAPVDGSAPPVPPQGDTALPVPPPADPEANAGAAESTVVTPPSAGPIGSVPAATTPTSLDAAGPTAAVQTTATAPTTATVPTTDAVPKTDAGPKTKVHMPGPPADRGSQGKDDDDAEDGQKHGNGPPADPGSQGNHGNAKGQDDGTAEGQGNGNGKGQGNGNAKGHGNGPPSDPGSQGQGQAATVALQSQGNGPPADPGSEGNGGNNGNGGKNGNGQGGPPSDLGAQGNQGGGQGKPPTP